MTHRTFGEFFKACRIKAGVTLRAFSQNHGFDPGNISRLERGRLAPPHSQEKLARYAEALGLAPDSDDWVEFHDLAAAQTGRIPRDILSDEEVVTKLPAVFRTLRTQKVDSDQLDELVERIRRT